MVESDNLIHLLYLVKGKFLFLANTSLIIPCEIDRIG